MDGELNWPGLSMLPSKWPLSRVMNTNILERIAPGVARKSLPRWTAPALLAVSVPCALLLCGGNSDLISFCAAAGCFAVLGLGYLGLHGLRGMAWCSVPVLLTVRALAEFLGIPAWQLAMGNDALDSLYVRAMFLTLIGFAAFWLGSLVVKKEARLRFVPRSPATPSRTAFLSLAMLILGLGAKLLLWQTGLLSYTADAETREASLAFLQWLVFCANLLNGALLVSAIEILGKQSTRLLIRFVFWSALVFSVAFGAISGMKEELLKPIFYLVLVYGITRGRIPRAAYLLPLLLVLIYPFENAYRANLDLGYRSEIRTVGGLGAVLKETFADVVEGPASRSDIVGTGLESSTGRLSLLTYVKDVVGLADPSLLNGDDKIWLAPVYAVVPRFLWKDKPDLNKGGRFSVLLGGSETTASTLTPIGDLYAMYGTFWLAAGMLTYGICVQIYMNWASRGHSERNLFVYLSMLLSLSNLEATVVGIVSESVHLFFLVLITSYIIYGRQGFPLRVAKSRRLVAQF